MNNLREAIVRQVERTTFMVPQGLMPDQEIEVIKGLKVDAILKLIEEALPERKYIDFFDARDMTPWKRMKARAFMKGYAKCLEDIKALLRDKE